MAYHRDFEGLKCDKCGSPIAGHCDCCGVLKRGMGSSKSCDCGAAWSTYVHDLIRELRKAAQATRCCFAGVGAACPVHEKR